MTAEVYLDNASTSFPKPDSVYQAIHQFIVNNGASPGRGSYTKAQESERIVIRLRSKLSRLLGIANPSDLLFTHNATDALNFVLKGYLEPGDHVITTDVEHNALLRPLWSLKKSKHIEVTILKSNSEGLVSASQFEQALQSNTKLIACVHASNVLGTLQPIGAISTIAQAHKIPFLVDGSQTAGAIPVNLETLGADMFAFTGHKSLLGLTGTGGIYIKNHLDIKPFREGGNGTHSNSLDQPNERPERYESGTPNMIGLVGLLAGVDFLLDRDIESIRNHERGLNQLLMHELEKIPGVKLYGPAAESKVAITSIGLDAIDTAEIGQMLGKKFGVCVRTGIHCSPLIHEHIGTKNQGTIRFSLGWSTTESDILTAARAIHEIASAIYRRV